MKASLYMYIYIFNFSRTIADYTLGSGLVCYDVVLCFVFVAVVCNPFSLISFGLLSL